MTTAERIADIRAATRAKLAHRPAGPSIVATPTGPTETLLLAIHRRGLDLTRLGTILIVTGPAAGWHGGERIGWGTALRRAIVAQAGALLAYATEIDAWEVDCVAHPCRGCHGWAWWGQQWEHRTRWTCLDCGASL